MSGALRFLTSPGIVTISVLGTAAGLSFYWKSYLGGAEYAGPEQLEGKVFIVTGANTGIGKATALELAKRKARVIMACKNMGKCQQARKDIVLDTRNRKVICRELDLASFESIRKFTAKLVVNEPKVDVLINNAAVMLCPRMVTKEGIEMQLGVNHLGHFLLTSLLLDKYKDAPLSRIINLTCETYYMGVMNYGDLNSDTNYNAREAYNQSKLATVIFTQELARRLAGTKTTVNLVDPGMTDTELDRYMDHRLKFYGYFYRPFLWFRFKYPRDGAQTVLYAAICSELDKVSGKLFENCAEKELQVTISSPEALRLWLTSEKWTRLLEQKKLLPGDIKEVQQKLSGEIALTPADKIVS